MESFPPPTKDGENGKSRDKAAERVEWSGRTAEKAAKVKTAIDAVFRVPDTVASSLARPREAVPVVENLPQRGKDGENGKSRDKAAERVEW